jgi:hypothetical protein
MTYCQSSHDSLIELSKADDTRNWKLCCIAGAKYELPKYVLSEPTNLIRDGWIWTQSWLTTRTGPRKLHMWMLIWSLADSGLWLLSETTMNWSFFQHCIVILLDTLGVDLPLNSVIQDRRVLTMVHTYIYVIIISPTLICTWRKTTPMPVCEMQCHSCVIFVVDVVCAEN